MAKDTSIEWTDFTYNRWHGCTKVSPGCANCYAEGMNVRFHSGANWGKNAPRRKIEGDQEKAVRRLNDRISPGHRLRVFTASMSDWLDDEVPIEWLAELLMLVSTTPNLDWQMLTKRPENFWTRLGAVSHHLADARELPIGGVLKSSSNLSFNRDLEALQVWVGKWLACDPPANVWMGVSVENQLMARLRIPLLKVIPARLRFLSMEPLLKQVTLTPYLDSHGIDWVIIGGESGPGARGFDCDWARMLIEECLRYGVSPFVKQLGHCPFESSHNASDSGEFLHLKSRKGNDPGEWPEELRVREFPKSPALSQTAT